MYRQSANRLNVFVKKNNRRTCHTIVRGIDRGVLGALEEYMNQYFQRLFLSGFFSLILLFTCLPPGNAFQIPEIEIQEKPASYDILIPLKNAKEEKQIQCNIEPKRIRVSGQIPILSPDGRIVLGTSSFMKAYTPAFEVDPKKIKRSYQNNLLIITVSKKMSGKQIKIPQESQTPTASTKNGLPPDVQLKLRQQAKTAI